VRDRNLARGDHRVEAPGVNGEETLRFRVTYVDGRQTDRRLLKRVVTRQPQHRVVAFGTGPGDDDNDGNNDGGADGNNDGDGGHDGGDGDDGHDGDEGNGGGADGNNDGHDDGDGDDGDDGHDGGEGDDRDDGDDGGEGDDGGNGDDGGEGDGRHDGHDGGSGGGHDDDGGDGGDGEGCGPWSGACLPIGRGPACEPEAVASAAEPGFSPGVDRPQVGREIGLAAGVGLDGEGSDGREVEVRRAA
jgi:hypothetical protein